jgi:hypothetical protein
VRILCTIKVNSHYEIERSKMDADISVQAVTQPIDVNLKSEDTFNPKPSMALRISAIVVPLITFCVQNWFVITVALIGSAIHPVQIAQMVGSLIGVILFPVIVVGLFQIGKRFRNARSRYRIFLFAALFSLFSSLFVRLVSFLAKAGSI